MCVFSHVFPLKPPFSSGFFHISSPFPPCRRGWFPSSSWVPWGSRPWVAPLLSAHGSAA